MKQRPKTKTRKSYSVNKRVLHTPYSMLHGRRGQTTLEVIIALTILTIALTSAVLVVTSGQSLSVDSEEGSQALRLAQKNIESSVSSAKADFFALASSTSVQGEFTKTVIVTNIDANTKQVVSRVAWSTDPLRTQNVELTTLVTNWQTVQDTGGDTGGSGASGNWCNPRTYGTVNLGAGESATGLDVVSSTVYMTATASSPSKADFFIVNVSDPQNPAIISSIDTGPGLNALDTTADYAYVANNKTSKQFQVIDISNKASPVVVSSTTLPGISQEAISIFYYNHKVYIGAQKGTGPEFHVFDVSVPASPVALGSFEIGANVTSISVRSSTAYVAVSTADGGTGLELLNVSNPASISQISSLNTNEESLGLYLVGRKLYLGAEEGDNTEFSILDITTSTSIQTLGTKNIGADVNAVMVRNNYAFLATSDSNKELQVYDISDPSNITPCATFNFPNFATSIDFENNLAYIAVRSNDGLRIVTSQ
jgi:hypothetical protein